MCSSYSALWLCSISFLPPRPAAEDLVADSLDALSLSMGGGGSPSRTTLPATDPELEAALQSGNRLLISGGNDRNICVWDLVAAGQAITAMTTLDPLATPGLVTRVEHGHKVRWCGVVFGRDVDPLLVGGRTCAHQVSFSSLITEIVFSVVLELSVALYYDRNRAHDGMCNARLNPHAALSFGSLTWLHTLLLRVRAGELGGGGLARSFGRIRCGSRPDQRGAAVLYSTVGDMYISSYRQ